jgi:hypothetical protein
MKSVVTTPTQVAMNATAGLIRYSQARTVHTSCGIRGP